MDHLAVEAVHDAGLPDGVARPARKVVVVIVILHASCGLHMATSMRTASDDMRHADMQVLSQGPAASITPNP